MKATRDNRPDPEQAGGQKLRAFLGAASKLLIAAAIVAGAIMFYRYQMRTSPRVGRKKPPRQARLVQVISTRRGDCTTTVTGDGVVMPAQQVTLRPQVIGKVVKLSADLVPGGIVRDGQKLLEIDRRDYDVLVRQRQSDVAKALRDLKVEQGNQAIARQEYELLGESVAEEDRELVLRQPQLASALAAHESAQAALEKAQLDLARCDVNAPFNAIVQERKVDLGATVSLNTDLVTLVGTDEAWVEVKVTVDQLKWLTIPQTADDSGSTVKIYNRSAWAADRFRTGRILCLLGEVEKLGRLARVLVSVDDPFCLKPENSSLPQLLMGSYVSAGLEGRKLAAVFEIDRSHLRENQSVWIMNDEGELEIREVKIGFSNAEKVFVTEGLADNEKLVVTDIAAPVQGMPLRLAQAEKQTVQDARVARKNGGRR
ncbi:MAG: efflux RND transporter periplasmic adaptor subunit [Planctomycetota bacterium]|jgi:RND family efflux transporter MFP subunit